MSKRSRRTRNERPKDEGQALPVGENREAETARDSELVCAGQAFLQFDEWMDGQLDVMVEKWIHLAAPAAATMRRVMPQNSRRITGQT